MTSCGDVCGATTGWLYGLYGTQVGNPTTTGERDFDASALLPRNVSKMDAGAAVASIECGLVLAGEKATAGTWLLIAKGFKISSLAALIATLLAPLYVWLIIGPSPELIITTAVMTLVLFWRHRTNIQRLLSGEEGVISKKS